MGQMAQRGSMELMARVPRTRCPARSRILSQSTAPLRLPAAPVLATEQELVRATAWVKATVTASAPALVLVSATARSTRRSSRRARS